MCLVQQETDVDATNRLIKSLTQGLQLHVMVQKFIDGLSEASLRLRTRDGMDQVLLS